MVGYDFFDLRKWDGESPLVSELAQGTLFYKLCDFDAFALKNEDLALSDATSGLSQVPETCAGMKGGHGFLIGGDGKCAYSFSTPVDFNGIAEDPGNEETDYIGFTLDFVSDQACGGGKFKLQLSATCGADESWSVSPGGEKADPCSSTISYTGPNGCKEYSVKFLKFAEILTPYMGAVMIVAGLLMVFMGAKLVLAIFGAGVFFALAFFLFTTFYNVILPRKTPVWVYAIVGIISVVAAGYASQFSRKFGQKYAVPLIGGWGGVILSLVVIEILGVKSATLTILMSLGLGLVGFNAA